MKKLLPTLSDDAILTLTKRGESELREPGTRLTPAQLGVLVLIDGHTTVAQLGRRIKDMPPETLHSSLGELVDKGLVGIGVDAAYDMIDPGDFFTFKTTPTELAEDGEASAETSADVEFLKRNGYYVTMARGPSVKPALPEGRNLTVLVIDDDEDICKVLRIFLKLEGFETRTASNRDEILAELRRPPLPDLVLLDVWMPDINGFDLLAKMRQHQTLKGLPVIMLTGDATRGAVLRGINGGADGFVTKPFEMLPLVRAVKTVLGLEKNP